MKQTPRQNKKERDRLVNVWTPSAERADKVQQLYYIGPSIRVYSRFLGFSNIYGLLHIDD